MKIFVNVRAGSKFEKIEEKKKGFFVVWTKALAREGRANAALVKILAKYFGVPQSAVKILSGFSSPKKIVGILK